MKAASVRVVDILGLGGVSSAAVGGTNVFYSESFAIENATYSFEYALSSEGTIKVKFELEQGNQVPTTEGASDGSFVVPDGALEFDNACEDALTHIKAYAPASAAFARVKVTGLATNDASTILSKLKMAIAK